MPRVSGAQRKALQDTPTKAHQPAKAPGAQLPDLQPGSPLLPPALAAQLVRTRSPSLQMPESPQEPWQWDEDSACWAGQPCYLSLGPSRLSRLPTTGQRPPSHPSLSFQISQQGHGV